MKKPVKSAIIATVQSSRNMIVTHISKRTLQSGFPAVMLGADTTAASYFISEDHMRSQGNWAKASLYLGFLQSDLRIWPDCCLYLGVNLLALLLLYQKQFLYLQSMFKDICNFNIFSLWHIDLWQSPELFVLLVGPHSQVLFDRSSQYQTEIL